MFSINEFSNLDELISEGTGAETVVSDSSNDGIDVSSLPIDVVLGEKYQEYVDMKQENEAQKQKNEELRSTIKKVQLEIDNRKSKLLNDLRDENEKLKSEGNSLELELNSLLGKDISFEEII